MHLTDTLSNGPRGTVIVLVGNTLQSGTLDAGMYFLHLLTALWHTDLHGGRGITTVDSTSISQSNHCHPRRQEEKQLLQEPHRQTQHELVLSLSLSLSVSLSW